MPSLMGCVRQDGTEVEAVVKLSAGCEMKHRSLVAEAITAVLAADLGLPLLVKVDADFAATITDPDVRQRAQASVGWNFGSMKLPAGFATILKDRPVPHTLSTVAAEILAFDTFIANPDRTVANPNCLTNGRQFAIIDHELAFFMDGIVGWVAPWEPGGVSLPRGRPPQQCHVFVESVRGTSPDFGRLASAWRAVSHSRIAEYETALPSEWLGSGRALRRILDYVVKLRDHLDVAIGNLREALL